MLKILHEIFWNVHSSAACKIFTKVQKLLSRPAADGQNGPSGTTNEPNSSPLFVTLFCRLRLVLGVPPHGFFSVLMWAQIFRAGPSLMFMLVIRWSSVRSSRAWPSISCSRNASATSPQPENKHTNVCLTFLNHHNYWCGFLPYVFQRVTRSSVVVLFNQFVNQNVPTHSGRSCWDFVGHVFSLKMNVALFRPFDLFKTLTAHFTLLVCFW